MAPLARSFATVGVITMASRLFGFARDVLMAAMVGTGPVADAFFVAFRFPNLFRRLFAEGAFNAAFVPLFARRLEGEGAPEARRFAEEALAVLTLTLVILTAVALLAMPLLMYVLAPGFAQDQAKFDLAVLLTRIAFPYLLCMSVVALLSGVLNSLGRFAAATAAPVLLNIVLIAVLIGLWVAGERETPVSGIALAWGVAVAGLLQLLMLAYATRRAGMALKLRRPRLTPGVKRLIRLGIPGAISGGITQINILIGTIIASLQAGAVSYLYYADRIYQLPLGVVGIAIGVVLLPNLARRVRAGDHGAVNHNQNRSLEFALLLTLPAAVALAVIPHEIVQVLFGRGAFDADDVAPTAWALFAFALGLPGFVLIKVFSPGFFAREDTVTPMRYAAAGAAVNVVASLALFFPFGHVGIAVATSLAGWLNAGLLGWTLMKRGHYTPDATIRTRLPMMAAAALFMGAVLWLAALWLGPMTGLDAPPLQRAAALGTLIVLGMAAYGAAVQISGAGDLGQIRAMMRRREPAAE